MHISKSFSIFVYLCCIFMMVPDKKSKTKQVKFDSDKPLKFTIEIDENEWESIKPTSKDYTDRKALVLQPEWTDLILDKVYEKYELECPFPMDRHKFYKRKGYPFLQFVGGCDECGAPITGTIQEEPNGFPYCVVIETFDTRGIKHVKPKPLRNKKRDKLREKARHTKPLKLRHQIANECLDDDGNLKSGSKERPDLNSTAVYSKLRHEIKKADSKNFPGDDVSELINLQIKHPEYIRLFSTDPAVILYWSQNQVDMWNEVALLGYYISIDASGKFVKKLRIIKGQKSSPIFFYNAVVRVQKKIYSLSQMLSSKHDVCQISAWLSKWLQSGALIPKGVIVDCAYALLNSVCIEFNHCAYVEFLNKCTNYLLGYSTELPLCNVKRDKAHLIKAMSVWNCFKGDNWVKKDLYLRVICFSLEIEVLEELREVVIALFIVSQSQYQSSQYVESLETLEKKISTFNHKAYHSNEDNNCEDCTHEKCSILIETDNFIKQTESDVKQTESDAKQTESDDAWKEVTSKDYILQLKAEADDLLEQDKAKDSTKVNPYLLPTIVPNLTTLYTQFPAWTNVMHPFYTVRPNKVSTSCGSEVYYRITRLDYGFSSPMSLVSFLLDQMPLIEGATKLARRSIKILLEELEKEKNNPKDSSEELYRTVDNILSEITNTVSTDSCLSHNEKDSLKASLKTNKENVQIDTSENYKSKRKISQSMCSNIDNQLMTVNKKSRIEKATNSNVTDKNYRKEMEAMYMIDLTKYKYMILLKDYYYDLPYLNLIKFTLTVEDFQSLRTPNFVSGSVIDAFMIIKLTNDWKNISVIPTSQTTFIVGDQWKGNHPSSWSMYQLDYNFNGKICLPYCFRRHWCLIVLDPENEIATHYDPLYENPKARHDYEKAFTYFLSRCPDSHSFKNKNWRWIENKTGLPRQRDQWNCGFFVMFAMTLIANTSESSSGRLVKFDPENYRFQVATLLLKDKGANGDICLYCFNDGKDFYDSTKKATGIKKCKTCDKWAHNFCIERHNTKLKDDKCELCLSRDSLKKKERKGKKK